MLERLLRWCVFFESRYSSSTSSSYILPTPDNMLSRPD